MDDIASLSLRIADLIRLRDQYHAQGKLHIVHVIETMIFDAKQKLDELSSQDARQA